MKLLQPRRFHPLKFAWVLVVFVAYVLYTTKRDAPPRVWSWVGPAYGSTYSVKVVTRDLDDAAFARLQEEAATILDRIDRQMSTWRDDSDLSRFNTSTSTAPFIVSDKLADVTRAALELSALSGGAFDITYAPMFALWGFGKDGPKYVPTEEQIAATQPRCGYEKLTIASSNQIQKSVPDLQYNLNAIAPGYAADQLRAHLRTRGFTNLYVDVGGEVVVDGHSPRGDRWRVGLERPEYDQPAGQEHYKVVHVPPGWALATSGDYRSYGRDADGRVFSHIFDTRTGRPATSRVASISVLATNGMMADAYATTLYAMGPQEGLNWLTNVAPAEALFIMRIDTGGFYEVASEGFPLL